MSRAVVPALASLLAVAAPRAAAADPPQPWLVYGGFTLEAAVAGTFYLNFSGVADELGEGTRLTVGTGGALLLPVGVGYLAHRLKLDPRPPIALEGAAAYGGLGFLVGVLVDGRDDAWGLRVGRTAWALGATGAVAGAVVGTLEVDGREEAAAWLGLPAAGFVVGGLGLGSILVLAGGLDGDHAMGQFTTGAVVGLGVGATAATVIAIRGYGDTAPGHRRQLALLGRHLPGVDLSRERLEFTLAGRF